MIKRFYFAVKDGCYDPETGEHDEAGMAVKFDEKDMPKDVTAFVEQHFPCYAGRLRHITEEEYMRDYGEDE